MKNRFDPHTKENYLYLADVLENLKYGECHTALWPSRLEAAAYFREMADTPKEPDAEAYYNLISMLGVYVPHRAPIPYPFASPKAELPQDDNLGDDSA